MMIKQLIRRVKAASAAVFNPYSVTWTQCPVAEDVVPPPSPPPAPASVTRKSPVADSGAPKTQNQPAC